MNDDFNDELGMMNVECATKDNSAFITHNSALNIPAIRFKGFTGEWEEKKLGEVCLIGDIDHKMPQSVKDGIPYLMTGDFIGINDLDFNNAKLISVEDYEQLSKKIKPETGDILFARYASVGAVRYVETNLKFTISYSCAILKSSTTYSEGRYLFYYLQSSKAQHQVELEINTGSQRNIGIDSLKKIIVTFPINKEKLKVSCFIKNLDTLITQHQQKHDKLLNLKKALLEKMFPKQGATVPEIRFKGFSGEWVEEKVINIAPLQRGFDLPKREMQVGKYPVVMSNGINGYHFNFKAKAPGVVTGRSGTIGNIHYIEDDYWPHNTALWVTNFKGNSPRYIYYMYTKLDLNRFGTGSGVPTLNRNDVHDQSINLPKETEEQTQIGNFFKQLDTLITQHQSQLKKLGNIKQACLEKMFV